VEPFDPILKTISLTLGAAWASGINLYAAILILGLLGVTENIVLPQGLEILMNPLVIGAAGLMYLVEFFADKVPVCCWQSALLAMSTQRLPSQLLSWAGGLPRAVM
jgi:hypothetical protein